MSDGSAGRARGDGSAGRAQGDLFARLARRALGQPAAMMPRPASRHEPAAEDAVPDLSWAPPAAAVPAVDHPTSWPAVGVSGAGPVAVDAGSVAPESGPAVAAGPTTGVVSTPERMVVERIIRQQAPQSAAVEGRIVARAASPASPAAPVTALSPQVPAAPRWQARAAEAAQPVRAVQIRIGRIEVRAPVAPAAGTVEAPPPVPASRTDGPAGLSLSAYLRGDNGRPR